MQETPIFFPIAPSEFYKYLRKAIEEVIDAKLDNIPKMPSEMAEKTLLLPKEVCEILRISKTTLYELVKEGKLVGFKIQSRRYFAKTDVEKMLQRQY